MLVHEPMNRELQRQRPSRIQGQMLRLSRHREVAIYLWDGRMWVADFIDGNGALVDASTWFRFNCGTLANSHALRRMALESAIPLSQEIVDRLEALHRETATRSRRSLARLIETIVAKLPPGLLATVQAHRVRRRQAQHEHSV